MSLGLSICIFVGTSSGTRLRSLNNDRSIHPHVVSGVRKLTSFSHLHVVGQISHVTWALQLHLCVEMQWHTCPNNVRVDSFADCSRLSSLHEAPLRRQSQHKVAQPWRGGCHRTPMLHALHVIHVTWTLQLHPRAEKQWLTSPNNVRVNLLADCSRSSSTPEALLRRHCRHQAAQPLVSGSYRSLAMGSYNHQPRNRASGSRSFEFDVRPFRSVRERKCPAAM
jgi:hypothetical protein